MRSAPGVTIRLTTIILAVRDLLAGGAGTEIGNPFGDQAALMRMALEGDYDVVRALGEKGATVNGKDEVDQTALSLTSEKKPKIITLLK